MEIIAEVGLAHDGSLSQAHAYIDACAAAGVDTVKFQCHLDDPCTEWRIEPENPQDADRQAYWKRTGFEPIGWHWLAGHCGANGVEFLCSPFSVAAVALLDPLVKRWKVPSGRVADIVLLKAIAETRKPVLLSTGMATLNEVGEAKRIINSIQLMQCTTAYPCPPEQIDLTQAQAWGGLSDHSGTIYPGLAAAALGCKVLEVHVCWSKEQGGFDTAASLDMAQLRQLVEGVRFIKNAMRPINKNEMAQQLAETRRVFM